jgi:hypothetical protein
MAPIQPTLAIQLGHSCADGQVEDGDGAWLPPPSVQVDGKGRLSYTKEWALLRSSEEGTATVEAGFDAIRRCANSSWFEWLEGSAPLFWNWPQEYQRDVRDGQPHYITGLFGTPYLRPQSKHKDPAKHELMQAKVVKVRRLGYIKAGKLESGTSFFSVDKGAMDIRMVYNGTSCGLNDILYAPHFGLPTVRATLRAILPGFFQCDLDVQDQFLNYRLHKSLREHSGVTFMEYALNLRKTRAERSYGPQGGNGGRGTGWG